MTGELQFISDTMLVERVFAIEYSFTKQAGLVDSVIGSLGSVKDWIFEKLKGIIDISSTGAAVKSVLKLFEGYALFKIHPVLGILDGIAQAMGYSIIDIVHKIVAPLIPRLMSGFSIAPGEVDQATRSLMQPIGATAMDGFVELRKLSDDGQLVKSAFLGGLLGGGSDSVLTRIFSFLPSAGQKHNLLVAFVGWFVKMILTSALLLGATKATYDWIRPGQTEQGAARAKDMPATMPTPNPGPVMTHMPNNSNNIWIAPVEGSVEQTLINWAIRAYPKLQGYEQIMRADDNFRFMVGELNKGLSRNGQEMEMPRGYSRWIDIVNHFAGRVFAKGQS